MGWTQSTQWIDNTDITLDDAIEQLMSLKGQTIDRESAVYSNFSFEKYYDKNEKVELSDKEIEYNVIGYSFDSVVKSQVIDETNNNFQGNIVVYSFANKVRYIIDRHTKAQFFLRMLLGYTKTNEIVQIPIKFENDFYIWLISKLYRKEPELIFNEDSNQEARIVIESLKSFDGETENENKVKVSGSTVLDLTSSLSFILENDLLNRVAISLKYEEHDNIEIRLNNNGSINFNDLSYSGIYEREDEAIILGKLLLIIHHDLVPKLNYSYMLQKSEWKDIEKEEFFIEVKQSIINKLNNIVRENDIQTVEQQ